MIQVLFELLCVKQYFRRNRQSITPVVDSCQLSVHPRAVTPIRILGVFSIFFPCMCSFMFDRKPGKGGITGHSERQFKRLLHGAQTLGW